MTTSSSRTSGSGPEPFDACPDGGRCWHGCSLLPASDAHPEGEGMPCSRVIHAFPLSGYGDDWTPDNKARHLAEQFAAEQPLGRDWVAAHVRRLMTDEAPPRTRTMSLWDRLVDFRETLAFHRLFDADKVLSERLDVAPASDGVRVPQVVNPLMHDGSNVECPDRGPQSLVTQDFGEMTCAPCLRRIVRIVQAVPPEQYERHVALLIGAVVNLCVAAGVLRDDVGGLTGPEALAPLRPVPVEAKPDADGPCQQCGRAYPAWWAPHDIWNATLGGPDATDDPGGMLCPTCFLMLAPPVRGAWHLTLPTWAPHAYAVEVLWNPDTPNAHWRFPIDFNVPASTRERAEEEVEDMVEEGYSREHLRLVVIAVAATDA